MSVARVETALSPGLGQNFMLYYKKSAHGGEKELVVCLPIKKGENRYEKKVGSYGCGLSAAAEKSEYQSAFSVAGRAC